MKTENTLKGSEETVRRLAREGDLPDKELAALIETDEYDELLFRLADERRREIYGTDVYIRGLIEFSNYCRNNC